MPSPASTPVPARMAWAASRMALTADARVLEVGCGDGRALALLAERAPHGEIVGIDRSAHQVVLARERLQGMHADRRPRVECMTLATAATEWSGDPFDAVLAINVNAFWTDATDALAHLALLLAPHAQAYLVFEPPSAPGVAKVRASLMSALEPHGLVAHDIDEVAFTRSRAILFVLRRGDTRR